MLHSTMNPADTDISPTRRGPRTTIHCWPRDIGFYRANGRWQVSHLTQTRPRILLKFDGRPCCPADGAVDAHQTSGIRANDRGAARSARQHTGCSVETEGLRPRWRRVAASRIGPVVVLHRRHYGAYLHISSLCIHAPSQRPRLTLPKPWPQRYTIGCGRILHSF